MNNQHLIKVLWVEDDPVYAESFIGLYADDLDITHVENWAQAQLLLDKDFNDYEVVLLDARCKNTSESLDNSKKFLIKAFSSLSKLMVDHKRILPWYVLSGGDKDEIDDLILEERELWDGDRRDPYYHKSQDEDLLVERIKSYCSSHYPMHLQIKEVLFRDVFEVISALSIPNIEDYMLYLLRPMVEPAFQYDVKSACGRARDILESVFTDMVVRGYMTKAVKHNNNSINMEWCSMVLAGEQKEISKQRDLYQAYKAHLLDCDLFGQLPKIMAKNLQTIYKTCCNVAHSNSLQVSQNRTYRYDEYQTSVGSTPYLLRGFALQLCDFIIWYNRWLKNHPKTSQF